MVLYGVHVVDVLIAFVLILKGEIMWWSSRVEIWLLYVCFQGHLVESGLFCN